MTNAGNDASIWPNCAAIFGASGGIGASLVADLAGKGVAPIYAGSRSRPSQSQVTIPFQFDLGDETSIAEAAQLMKGNPPDLVMVTTGVLTLGDGTGPERTYKRIDPAAMAEVFQVNTIGPALIAKHILPLMPRDRRIVFAALSARVGSIGDNSLGGWHSYRASKAGLNMLLRNFALELGRSHPQSVVVGLHPGTVDTGLSEPFQKGLPEGQLTAPTDAAHNLLGVISRLRPDHSGRVFDWKGEEIPA